MLEFIKPVFNFLCYDFGSYFAVIGLSIFIANAFVFLLQLTLSIFSKTSSDSSYFLCFSLVFLLLFAYFSIRDYLGEKTLFNDAIKIYSALTLYSVLILVCFAIIKRASNKPIKEETNVNCEKAEQLPPVSNAVKYFKKDEIFSGYLDVSYVKQLINELKQKDITERDYEQIEELEVYLLRFITRQPNAEERVVLSEQLSMLIKKLALYAS